MELTNRTVYTKEYLVSFTWNNMMHKGNFNVLIFPFIMICSAILLLSANVGQDGLAYAVMIIAVAIPVFLISLNFIMLFFNMRKSDLVGRQSIIKFTDKGFNLLSIENSPMITYDFVKQVVKFSDIYIIYFKGADPIFITRSGFPFGGCEAFDNLMMDKLGKKRFIKRKR